MALLTIPKPSVPKPKSGLPPAPKSGQPPRPPSPYANAPLKAPIPANPIKPALQVGGLFGGLPNGFGKQPTGTLTRTVTKAAPMPKPKSIAQQAADLQRKQLADIKRVEAALNADKRANASSRRALA